MIQMQTVLNVADNSGAKKVACIKVLGGSKRRYAGVGDVIVVSVKEAIPNSKVKKGDVIATIEAMKMEQEIKCETEVEVKEIYCKEGAPVSSGDLLMQIL